MRFALLPKLVIGLVVGLGIGFGLVAAALVLGVAGPREVSATHSGSLSVHACVSRYTGQARIMRPGEAPNCTGAEFLVELGSGEAIVDLDARLTALEAQVPDCLTEEAGDAVFSGCDVEVRNGLGDTGTTNGKGNLIVGYNENPNAFNRDGSHNIVVGRNHGYSSFGGLVVGINNQITGAYASVSGGSSNVAVDQCQITDPATSRAHCRLASVVASTMQPVKPTPA